MFSAACPRSNRIDSGASGAARVGRHEGDPRRPRRRGGRPTARPSASSREVVAVAADDERPALEVLASCRRGGRRRGSGRGASGSSGRSAKRRITRRVRIASQAVTTLGGSSVRPIGQRRPGRRGRPTSGVSSRPGSLRRSRPLPRRRQPPLRRLSGPPSSRARKPATDRRKASSSYSQLCPPRRRSGSSTGAGIGHRRDARLEGGGGDRSGRARRA